MAAVDLFERFEPVDAATPRAARRAVSEFARHHVADDAVLSAIALCVTEAVTNVVLHAYRDASTPGAAVIRGWVEPDAIRIAVRDYGVGLLPRVDTPGVGVGMPLIAQLTSEADFRTRSHGGTEVEMRFEIG